MIGYEARAYEHLVSSKCVILSNAGGTSGVQVKQKLKHEIIVHSIAEGKDNWRRIDISTDGIRSNVYHNTYSTEFVCGWRNWSKKNLVDIFKKPTYLSSTDDPNQISLSDADPKQRVMCELRKTYVGGDRHVELFEDECIRKGGAVLKHIQSLPEGIGRHDYVKCLAHGDTKPVNLKAMVCMQVGGTIVDEKS